MSSSIDGTSITMTRGDTMKAAITLTKDGEPYEPAAGDSIRFALKHTTLNANKTDYADTTPLILKQIPTDTMELTLDPEDTKGLAFGSYIYDIEVTFADGSVDTVIPTAGFRITPEVH